ncbi:nucleophile aminohydrolase [Chytridium lagenaria]|nr:nucleophile aminohydrolase [Chytridium lagenaria]
MTPSKTQHRTPMQPAILLHGGAWAMDDATAQASITGIHRALQLGITLLKSGHNATEVAVTLMRDLESDPTFDAGTGSFLTAKGEVELDAMIGTDTLRIGSVCGLKNTQHPIDVARCVMEKLGDAGCVMLSGEGAEEFARECGIPHYPTTNLITPRELSRFTTSTPTDMKSSFRPFPATPSDTVGCLVRDHSHLVVALTTGGTPMKRSGRVGDTPLWGCGGYAYKGRGAASTGYGEDLIRVVMAKSAVDRMTWGKSAMEAAREQVGELEEACGGLGGVIVLGEDGPGVAFNTPRMVFGYWGGEGDEVVVGCEKEDLEKLVGVK